MNERGREGDGDESENAHTKSHFVEQKSCQKTILS